MAKLNFPNLGLPAAPETVAFRTVERILATDPTVKRVTRQFSSYDGDASDVLDPTFATCPYLRIGPAPLGSGWEAEGLHRFPLLVGIQVAVGGTCVDQLMNYWHVIRSALWPADPARNAQVRTWIAESRIIRPVMTLCGYRSEVKEGLRMLVAEGSLELTLHIDTP